MNRRSFLVATGGAGAVVAAGCSGILTSDDVPFDGDPDQWPQTLHDPGNTGRNPEANGPREELEREWVLEPDSTIEGTFGEYSAPVVQDGDVYVVERWRQITGEDDPEHVHILALDEDGNQRWTEGMGFDFRPPRLTRFGLTVDGGDLVSVIALPLGSLVQGPESSHIFEVTRFNSETGASTDSIKLGEEAGAPTLANGRLYAQGRTEALAIDPDDVDVKERFVYDPEDDSDPELFLPAVGFPPTVVDGTLYACAKSRFMAVEPAANEPRWVVDADEDLPELWNAELGGWFSHPGVDDSRAYTALGAVPNNPGEADRSPGPAGGVAAIDRDSGEVEWTWQPAIDTDWSGTWGGSPAIDRDRVYVCGYRGLKGEDFDTHLYALDNETGDQVWEQPIDGHSFAPVMGDETVYVVTDAVVTALDASDGEVLARDSLTEFDPDRKVPPAVVDGRLIVSTTTGVISYGE